MHREILAELGVSPAGSRRERRSARCRGCSSRTSRRARADQPREAPDLRLFSPSFATRWESLRDGLGRPLGRRQPLERGGDRPTGLAERVVRRDPVGQRLRKGPEVLGARHEIGLAVDLEQHGRLRRDARDDEPFGGGAAGLRRRPRGPSCGGSSWLPRNRPAASTSASLAIHHSRAGLGAQIRDQL